MLTVLIECRNEEPELAQTLSVLVSGAVEGLVREVVVLDHAGQGETAHIADAAGCRYHRTWDLQEVLQHSRGDWLLLLEPGARPQGTWIEDLAHYMSLARGPARFSEARAYRRSFFRRIGRPASPLELGLLLPKKLALAMARSGMPLSELTRGQKARPLSCELVPARVARAAS